MTLEFSVPIAFCPIDQLAGMAAVAEECGFTRVTLPDSLFYPEQQDLDYPYTQDGSRMWDEDTPWVEPLTAIAALGSLTERIRFCPQVLKLGPRSPLLLARQISTVTNLIGDRLDLGVGIGWDPNEFEWCGVPFAGRGKRVDEMIEILRLAGEGGFFEFHGKHFDFGRLSLDPAPPSQIPLYIGGHTEIALKRAARVGSGWTSAMMTAEEIGTTVRRLGELLEERGRSLADRGDGRPFAIQVVCMDKYGSAGFAELEELGVTDVIVMPWMIEGHGFDAPLEAKKASIENFARKYIAS